jgi:hypothetical protein
VTAHFEAADIPDLYGVWHAEHEGLYDAAAGPRAIID